MLPTCTLPKLKLVGLAVRLPAVTAVPESAMFTGLIEPSLVSAKFPLTVPADDGAKMTLKVTLCPGVKVTGALSPEMLKPSPVVVASEIVPVEPPILVTVSVCVWFWPTCTFEKVKLVGAALRVAGFSAVPERAISSVVLDPLTVRDKVPLLEPVAVGAKTTANVVLWLGANVSGRLSPV